jgi:hypothetical protein
MITVPVETHRRDKWDRSAKETGAPLALPFIPPFRREEEERDLLLLSTALQGLVLDSRHPVALELAGTAQQRSWLIRAATPEALQHAEIQLRARFPDAEFVPVNRHDDPFQVAPHETVSALELRTGAAPYLPLQTDTRILMQKGSDPILGLLAALDALPDDLRAVAQLALVPASPTWSRPNQRKAIEHALEPERSRERWQMMAAREGAGAPSTVLLIGGGFVLGVLLLYQRFQRAISSHVPLWARKVLSSLAHGQWSQLSAGQQVLFIMSLAGLLLGGLLVVILVDQLCRRWFRRPIYDMQRVAEQTSRMAYRVRLRLYVIGPAFPRPTGLRYDFITFQERMTTAMKKDVRSQKEETSWQATIKRFWQPLRLLWKMTTTFSRHVWRYGQKSHQQRQRRHALLARLVAAYRQFHLASGNYFVPHHVWSWQARRAITSDTWKRGVRFSHQYLTVDAVAALWHIPAGESLPSLAQVSYRQSHTFLVPPALREACQSQPLVGFSEHAGHRIPFGFPPECLRSHFLIGGKSGEGKSTLLEHLIQGAMRGRGGVVVVDPHGDLVEHTLRLVPEHRLDDVVLIDLAETAYAIGFNPLDVTMGHRRDKAISDLLKIFSHIWVNAWGSRMEVAFQMALRTLFEANAHLCQHDPYAGASQQYILLDVMPVLTDESFCHALLQHIDDPLIRRWWETYYDPLSLYMQRDRSDPVLSKVARFESSVARHIVGQSQSTINLAQCVQEEKLLFIKLAKGVVGEDVAAVLGSTMLGLLQLALEEQAEETQRKQLPLFIDEFQVLEGVDWATLAELRKYGASFYLATQSLDYLQESFNKQVLPTVLANVKQLAIFHMSARDARILGQELGVAAEDITHLASYTCYLKLQYAGERTPTFSLKLSLPPGGDESIPQRIREKAHQRYMRPAAQVDTQIKERLARTLGAQPKEERDTSSEKRSDLSASPYEGKARQERGYRGRKSQEQKPPQEQARPGAQDVTPMNWSETVGRPPGGRAGRAGGRSA